MINFNLSLCSAFIIIFSILDSLKRKLLETEAKLHVSQAKLKDRESLISVMEPANKKQCVTLENKLEQYKRQNQVLYF